MTPLITAEKLAEALSLSGEQIRRLTRDGTIPCHRIGGAVRYNLADVLAITQVQPKKPEGQV